MEAIFRSIVLFTIAMTVVFWSLPYLDYAWLSEAELSLLNQSGYGAFFKVGDLVYWGILVIWVAISFGLYFFVPIAKPAFIAFYALNFLTTPLYGIQVLAGYEVLVLNLIGLADGIIIAMLLFTSMGAQFAKSS